MSLTDAISGPTVSILQGSGPIGGLLGDISGGNAQKADLEAQAEQARINARQIAAATEIETRRARIAGRARAGAASASAGASGATFTGSALDLFGDELFEAVLTEAVALSRGGQAETQQLNIASQRTTAGRNALTGANIGLVVQGIKVGASSAGGSIL